MIGRFCSRGRQWFALNNQNLTQILNDTKSQQHRGFAKKSAPAVPTCCKEIDQAKGRRVQEWPDPADNFTSWRADCPRDPTPPNSDPYRIKVHEVIVPPLPASNVKWDGVVLTDDRTQGQNQQPGYPGYYGQQQYDEHGNPITKQEEEKDEGFLGALKNLFGRGKKDKSEDQFSSLNELPCEDRELFRNPEIKGVSDLFHNSAIVHPDYWKEKPEKRELPKIIGTEPLPRLSYHGRTKYKFAFHEPWKPLDRITLLAKAEKDETEQSVEHSVAQKLFK